MIDDHNPKNFARHIKANAEFTHDHGHMHDRTMHGETNPQAQANTAKIVLNLAGQFYTLNNSTKLFPKEADRKKAFLASTLLLNENSVYKKSGKIGFFPSDLKYCLRVLAHSFEETMGHYLDLPNQIAPPSTVGPLGCQQYEETYQRLL